MSDQEARKLVEEAAEYFEQDFTTAHAWDFIDEKKKQIGIAIRQLLDRQRWIPVSERLPTVNGPAVIVYNAKLNCILGVARFTTELGDVYEGTDNAGEPAWDLYSPYSDQGSFPVNPNDVTHWQEQPQPPEQKP